MIAPNHLIVFARQPHFGIGKSRLSSRTNKWNAWQFQRRQILELGKLAQDGRWKFSFCWEHEQGSGDLGKRLQRALYGPVGPKRLVIGSDILDLKPHHIARAFGLLDISPHVLGPSPDGGFWCLGTRKPLFLKDIRWSSEFTLIDTVKSLRNVVFADRLADLD